MGLFRRLRRWHGWAKTNKLEPTHPLLSPPSQTSSRNRLVVAPLASPLPITWVVSNLHQHGCCRRISIIMSGNGAIQPCPEGIEVPHADDFDLSCSIAMHHDPQCCCGNQACTFLRETQDAFDRLDDSLRTAGRLGQVSVWLFSTFFRTVVSWRVSKISIAV